jgi:large subunit ribosomal protein L6
MALKNIGLEIVVPQGTEAKIDNDILSISGPAGAVKRNFYHPKVVVSVASGVIKIEGKKLNSKEKIVVYTLRALINCMVKGVAKSYNYELKVCSGHFPIKAGIEGKQFVIRNLFGEREPRSIEIPENVKINVSGNVVKVESVDKELAGQTAAKIERATIRPGFDKRVFQDGVYIVKKADQNE